MAKSTEVKSVKLSDNACLLSLTSPCSTFADYGKDHEILVGAAESHYGYWAAYFETPWLSKTKPSFLGIV